MQPDLGSNRGPYAYRANALPTELPDCLHIIHTVPVHTQVTLATLFLKRVWIFCMFYFYFRYVSKFRQPVKSEYSSNRADHRTMGQAKVPVPTTENFLKKHSKEPQLPDSEHIFIYTLRNNLRSIRI